MPANVEIKARVRDPQALRARVEALSDRPGELLVQEDTFFHAAQGRLKLRVLAPGRGELIHYHRPDASGPKVSDYAIFRTADPDGLKRLLGAALGVRGVVRKRRWLYWSGRTRIHLDEVEALGHFLEFEVMLDEDEAAETGEAEARALLDRLGIPPEDLLSGAYMDLLEKG